MQVHTVTRPRQVEAALPLLINTHIPVAWTQHAGGRWNAAGRGA